MLRDGQPGDGPVVYWMSRDQRSGDNWAVHAGVQLARQHQRPLVVIFCLMPEFLGATWRQYDFMLRGLRELEPELGKKRIGFVVRTGFPGEELPRFIHQTDPLTLLTDFSPLRIHRRWQQEIVDNVSVPVVEVDAHNIVPCWIASPKQEYAARTFRPKVHRALDDFLQPFPRLVRLPEELHYDCPPVDWDDLQETVRANRAVSPVTWCKPGETAARRALKRFITSKLSSYNSRRNDPTLDGQSHLSPYLHFGQLSAQRVALNVLDDAGSVEHIESFLEELIVRRELSDNYCYYNRQYDEFAGFPEWARKTLDKHRDDFRTYVYPISDLEDGITHDPLWNAAQQEMVTTGKMHGFMRMYWAKKILEWSPSPEEAQYVAIYLNDKYSLDGRDPNGYTGIAWSIGGVHDRPWSERDIFGTVRYMSYTGCKRKFDVDRYISQVSDLWEQ